MNDLKIFNNPEFGDIRTITINNEPYFVGKDVAEILGYSKARNAIATHQEMPLLHMLTWRIKRTPRFRAPLAELK